jgi:antitoxin (DNA-binding transcriptional repressor) of toxin-antitoxin stability system
MLQRTAFPLGRGAIRPDIATMQTVTLTEAQEHLKELVRAIDRQGELFITDADAPVAKLSPVTTATSLRHLSPTSVGAVLRPFPSADDDTLGEMVDSR